MRQNSYFLPWEDYRRNVEPEISRPAPKYFTDYKVFIVLAILGMQSEADAYFRQNTSAILKVAKFLQRKYPPIVKELYRGMLIPPNNVTTSRVVGSYGNHQYVSFSENLQVACWFADVKAALGEEAMAEHPDATGWIGHMTPILSDILFHHSWASLLREGPGPDILKIAQDLQQQLQSNDIVMEFKYHLTHQEEVICQKDVRYSLRPVDEHTCMTTQELTNQFTPYFEFMTAPAGLEVMGIQAGQRIYIERSEYHQTPRACVRCGGLSVTATRYWRDVSIFTDECQACHYVWRRKP